MPFFSSDAEPNLNPYEVEIYESCREECLVFLLPQQTCYFSCDSHKNSSLKELTFLFTKAPKGEKTYFVRKYEIIIVSERETNK